MSGPTATATKAFEAVRAWAIEAMRMAAEMASGGIVATEKGARFDMITPADAAIIGEFNRRRISGTRTVERESVKCNRPECEKRVERRVPRA